MKQVFADACYWIAIVNPGDSLSDAAHRARAQIDPAILVTTDEA